MLQVRKLATLCIRRRHKNKKHNSNKCHNNKYKCKKKEIKQKGNIGIINADGNS